MHRPDAQENLVEWHAVNSTLIQAVKHRPQMPLPHRLLNNAGPYFFQSMRQSPIAVICHHYSIISHIKSLKAPALRPVIQHI